MAASVRTIEDVRAALEEKKNEILEAQQRIDAAEQEMKLENVPWELRIQRLDRLHVDKQVLRNQQTALEDYLLQRKSIRRFACFGFTYRSPAFSLGVQWSVRGEMLLVRLAWMWTPKRKLLVGCGSSVMLLLIAWWLRVVHGSTAVFVDCCSVCVMTIIVRFCFLRCRAYYSVFRHVSADEK